MDLLRVVAAPIRIPLRLVSALDDLAALADRARQSDPTVEVRERLDRLMAQLTGLERAIQSTTTAVTDVDATGRRIETGGRELTQVAQVLATTTAELVAGGGRLTKATEALESDIRVLTAALREIIAGLQSVDRLEESAERVAETIEPLKPAAERVGRVTERIAGRRTA